MNRLRQLAEWFMTEPYIAVNISLAVVIVLIMAYSAFFSPEKDNYPVVCMHEKLTGESCISCGLSHSFSLIVRGRFSESFDLNPYGFRVFLFFLAQLAMRLTFTFYYLNAPSTGKQLIIYDISGTMLLLLIAFFPFLSYIFNF